MTGKLLLLLFGMNRAILINLKEGKKTLLICDSRAEEVDSAAEK